jgi:hypothetical protein
VPKWLVPWLFPVFLLVAVLAGLAGNAAGIRGGTVLLSALVILVGGLLVWLRLRYLKENPPDPELQHKPFWRF